MSCQHWCLKWILLIITISAAVAAPANKGNKGAKNAQKVAATTTAAPSTPVKTVETTTDQPQAIQTTKRPSEVMSRSMDQISSPDKQANVKKQDDDQHHSNEETHRKKSYFPKSKLKEVFRKEDKTPVYNTSLAQLMIKYQNEHSKVDLEEENRRVVDTGQGHPGSSKYSHRIPSHKEDPNMKSRPHKLKHGHLKKPRKDLRQPNGEHRSSEETVQHGRDPDALDNDDVHAERINLHFESHKPNPVLKHDLVLAGSGNRGLIGTDGGHNVKTAEGPTNLDPNDTEQTMESSKGRNAGGGSKKKEKGKEKEMTTTPSPPSTTPGSPDPQQDPKNFGHYLPWKQIPVPSSNNFQPPPFSLGETIAWDAEAHQDLLDRKLFKPLRQERPKKARKMSAGARLSNAYAERVDMFTGGKMDEEEKKRIADIISKKYGVVKVIKSAGKMGKGITRPMNRALGSQNFELAKPDSNLANGDAILLPEVGPTDVNSIMAIEEAENGTLFVQVENELDFNKGSLSNDIGDIGKSEKNGDLTSQNKTAGSEEDSLHPHIYRDMKKNHISPLDEARYMLERLKGKTNVSRSMVDDEPEEIRHARVKAILGGKKHKKKKKSKTDGDKDQDVQNGGDGKGLQVTDTTKPAKKKKKSKSSKNRNNEDSTTSISPISPEATTTTASAKGTA